MSTSIILPTEMADQIEQILVHLRRSTEAECVLLADISGQLIDAQSRMREVNPVLVATLAASDIAAMAELAHQVGEENARGSVLHEGKHKSIYLVNVAGSFILIVIFQAEIPIGLVRLLAGRAAERLQTLVAGYEEHLVQPEAIPPADFGAALMGELEKAFGHPGEGLEHPWSQDDLQQAETH
jgi:predicted regulator of Ras-like GTPase activity (Roadblock/LC7/MglB family)